MCEINSKIFFLADILFLEVILDLDIGIFPRETCFICGVTLRFVLDSGKYGI